MNMQTPNTISCTSCGADWSESQFSLRCSQCGNGALQRTCPKCRGLCGSFWRRAILDSQDENQAHWVGTCRFDGGDTAQSHISSDVCCEWWLDDSALPDLFWACLISSPGRSAIVLDLDGVQHTFADYRAAAAWLREDEYDLSSFLIGQSTIDIDVVPPAQMVALALHISGQFCDGFS